MTDISALIAELRQKRINLQAVNGQLKVEASTSALTVHMRQTITEYGAEILAYLLNEDQDQPQVTPPAPKPESVPVPTPAPIAAQAKTTASVTPVKVELLSTAQPGKPLSIQQEHLWHLTQQHPDIGFYQVKYAFNISGRLHLPALQTALMQLLTRHEVLRSTILLNGDTPVHVPHTEFELNLQFYDLTHTATEQQATELRQAMQPLLHAPFQLTSELPIRAAVFSLSPTKNILLLVIHHLVNDAWCSSVLRRELSQLYVHAKTGMPHSLPKISWQFAEFAAWQRQHFSPNALAEQLNFWRKELHNLPPNLALPTDYARPATTRLQAGEWVQEFDTEFLKALRQFSRSQNVTVFMAVLIALQILLFRLTGQRDFAIATPVTQRQRQDLEHLLGYFVNHLLLRSAFKDTDTFASLLQSGRKQTIAALKYPHVPLNLLVQELFPEQAQALMPLAQVLIAIQNQHSRKNNWGDLQVEAYKLPEADLRFDVEIHIHEDHGELQLTWLFRKDLWQEATIQQWGRCLHILLTQCIQTPNSPISDFSLLQAEAKQQIIQRWSLGDGLPVSNLCAQQMFDQQAQRTPDAVALRTQQKNYTYQELNAVSNQFANYLLARDLSIETPVALFSPLCPEAIICILGILKAGCAYVAICPELPSTQLKKLLDELQPALCITDSKLATRVTELSHTTFLLDQHWQQLTLLATEAPNRVVSLKNLAYITYTADNAGVLVEHYALSNVLIASQNALLRPQADQLCLLLSPFSQDQVALELFLPLISGACLVLPEPAALNDLEQLQAFLDAQPLSFIQAHPELFKALSLLGWEPKAGQTLVCNVELLSNTLRKKLSQSAKLWQLFGSPETTIYSLLNNVQAAASSQQCARPIANTDVYILNPQLQPVAPGLWGELYIGGFGLARGYLNKRKLTQERFIAHPFSKNSAARVFKTGARVRWLADGQIEFAGRFDRQVLLRGQSIDLAAIENQVQQHAAVSQAVVTVNTEHEEPVLLAYYVASSPELSPRTLRAELSKVLAPYQLPQQFIKITAIPLTLEGKIDIHALNAYRNSKLPAPELSSADEDTLTQLIQLCIQQLKPCSAIHAEDRFLELGGTPLAAIHLMTDIEQKFGARLTLASILQNPSLLELSQAINTIANPAPLSSVAEDNELAPENALPTSALLDGESEYPAIVDETNADPLDTSPVSSTDNSAPDTETAKDTSSETEPPALPASPLADSVLVESTVEPQNALVELADLINTQAETNQNSEAETAQLSTAMTEPAEHTEQSAEVFELVDTEQHSASDAISEEPAFTPVNTSSLDEESSNSSAVQSSSSQTDFIAHSDEPIAHATDSNTTIALVTEESVSVAEAAETVIDPMIADFSSQTPANSPAEAVLEDDAEFGNVAETAFSQTEVADISLTAESSEDAPALLANAAFMDTDETSVANSPVLESLGDLLTETIALQPAAAIENDKDLHQTAAELVAQIRTAIPVSAPEQEECIAQPPEENPKAELTHSVAASAEQIEVAVAVLTQAPSESVPEDADQSPRTEPGSANASNSDSVGNVAELESELQASEPLESEQTLANNSSAAPESREGMHEHTSSLRQALSEASPQLIPRVAADSLIQQCSPVSNLPKLYLCGAAEAIAAHSENLQILGLASGFGAVALTTENMLLIAQEYVQDILAFDPEGPYRIGGYEFGGRIAFHIAQQLQALGKSVEILVLLDQILYENYTGTIAFFILQQNNLLRELQQPGSTKILLKHFPHGWILETIPGQHENVLQYVSAMVISERLSARVLPTGFKPLAKNAVQVEWKVLDIQKHDATLTLHLNLKNSSTQVWPAGQMALGHHWQDIQGVLIAWAAGKMPIKTAILPGQSIDIEYTLAKSAENRNAFLILDLLDLGGTWFSLAGASSFRMMINSTDGLVLPAAELEELFALHAQGKLHQVIPFYQQLLEASTTPQPEIVRKLAEAFLHTGRSENAKKLLISAFQDPSIFAQDSPSHLLLAEIYLITGMYAAALSEAEYLLTLDPQNLEAIVLVGLAHAHLVQWPKAIQAMEQLLRLSPENHPLPRKVISKIESFNFLLDKYQQPETLKFAHWLIDKDALNPMHKFNCAYFLFRRKQLGKAEQLLLDALACAPEHPMFMSNLAKLYIEQENMVAAAQIYRKLTKLLPLKIENYVMLAQIRSHQGQYQAALDILEQASKLNPDDASLAQCRAEIKSLRPKSSHI